MSRTAPLRNVVSRELLSRDHGRDTLDCGHVISSASDFRGLTFADRRRCYKCEAELPDEVRAAKAEKAQKVKAQREALRSRRFFESCKAWADGTVGPAGLVPRPSSPRGPETGGA